MKHSLANKTTTLHPVDSIPVDCFMSSKEPSLFLLDFHKNKIKFSETISVINKCLHFTSKYE